MHRQGHHGDRWWAGWVPGSPDAHRSANRNDPPPIALRVRTVTFCGAGFLLTTVVDVKHSRDRTYLILDAGINVLGGMSGLGRVLPMRVRLIDDTDGAVSPTPVDLAGPTCTPLDLLARAVPMAAVRPGAVLAIPNVGAYGLSASLIGFLSRPLPAEVCVGWRQPGRERDRYDRGKSVFADGAHGPRQFDRASATSTHNSVDLVSWAKPNILITSAVSIGICDERGEIQHGGYSSPALARTSRRTMWAARDG